ncbi:molybdopterin molybdotransferase [Haloferula luteola]|uniref:Molybdopterin molybdenumtransferase n=1 Tax=Haloferula luteola TaxID=595692 RepID=A0A840UY86_9BACT|nr:molybdopterin molybdotransferase [Haloferula luteola]
MDDPITPAEADAIIASSLWQPATDRVSLVEAVGRTLTRAIHADRDLPPYARAMMDGVAFSSSSPPHWIQGLHAAGDPPPTALSAEHAWEIMTGACVPADCDTVVPYEDITLEPQGEELQILQILETYEPGQYIHPTGSDALSGEVLVPADRIIGPAEIAIAASVGLTELEVAARPRIALISSGDEAIPVADHPQPWQIRRSNGPMLEALLRRASHVPRLVRHVPDDADVARDDLHDALAQSDLVILCGGISKGKRDLIRPLLEEKLGPPAFHGVFQRPGKPLAFWSGPPLVFALPGNPVSVLATFTRYVLPALSQLEGSDLQVPTRPSPPELQPLPHLTWLLALDAAGNPLPPRNSGDFVSISGAAGFLEVPPAPDCTDRLHLRFFSCSPS